MLAGNWEEKAGRVSFNLDFDPGGSVFGGDSTAPFACSPAFIPLDIREQDGEIQVSVQP